MPLQFSSVTSSNLVSRLFAKVYKHQPLGLDSVPAAYLSGKRDKTFIISFGKVLPILRKSLSFSFSSGHYLSSVSFSANSEVKRSLYSSIFTDFVGFLGKVPSVVPLDSWISAVRFWSSPFRPGYVASWIPGTLTNYYSALKGYHGRSAPKINPQGVYSLSRDFQAWFLPRWFPALMVVFSLPKGSSAIRESSRLAIPTTSVGFSPTEGVSPRDITYPIVGHADITAGVFMYKTIVQNYYAGVIARLTNVMESRVARAKSTVPQMALSGAYRYVDEEQREDGYPSIFSSSEPIAETRARMVSRFSREEASKAKESPKRNKSAFVPTPQQKMQYFQPFFDSRGKSIQLKKAEYEKRKARWLFDNPRQIPPLWLGYGLYLDKE